jgi:hypothetical protein
MTDPFEQRLRHLDPQTLEAFQHQIRNCPPELAFDTLYYARVPVEMAELVAYKQRLLSHPASLLSSPPPVEPVPASIQHQESSIHDPGSSISPPAFSPSTISHQPSTGPRAHRPMSHPRNGRIAKLPEDIRNQVNEMLDKDIEYRRIIDFLQSKGYSGIQMCHISRWKDGGYLDYRQHQERCEELEMRRKWAEELAQQCQGDSFDDASKKLLTILFYEGLNRLDSIAMARIEHDPKQIVNFFRTFISFRRECLAEKKLADDQRHRQQLADQKASSVGRASLRADLVVSPTSTNANGTHD